MASSEQMMKLQFNLKFTAKQFAKDSKKCEKETEAEKKKAAKAIEKGNIEVARIHGQNAIRKKNEGINFLKLSARMDAVQSRIATAIKMKAVTKQMGVAVKGMDKVLQSMKFDEIARVMDKFEEQCENLDVATEYTENAMGQTTALTTPASEVDNMLSQIKDEYNLELKDDVTKQGQAVGESDPMAELEARLAALKTPSGKIGA
eukprot:TRINITY_DN123_c0_g8_i1.p2 TRINITY_DN123_c0_g8~~TRINITY_DN123_c0_g8_i1.p2  ORF type:complete len:204 (+),score=112.55 TRINITY_DN123_c0_g8_i1:47-658(+)